MTEADDRAALEDRIRVARAAQDWETAATVAIDGYGPEILRYLMSLVRDEAAGADVFSQFCESVWVGLPGFRGDSTFRVWAYAVARNAWFQLLRDPHRKRERRLRISEVPSVELVANNVRSRTVEYLRTETKDKIDALRAKLDPDDQSLLILRVNRKLEWNDIARALAEPDEPLDDKQLAKRAAALRKRFQRIKDDLRAAAEPRDDQ